MCACVCSFFSLKGVVSRRHPEEINPLIDGRVGLPLNADVCEGGSSVSSEKESNCDECERHG